MCERTIVPAFEFVSSFPFYLCLPVIPLNTSLTPLSQSLSALAALSLLQSHQYTLGKKYLSAYETSSDKTRDTVKEVRTGSE